MATKSGVKEQMTPEYRKTLTQMMESQAYRELAAAQMFGYGLQFIPDIKSLKFLTWHVTEEMEHYEDVAVMYREFTGESVEPVVNKRLKEKPVPFAQSWFELAMAQFLYDRGGFWQLKDYEACSYQPYRKVIQKIIKEEAGHQDLGQKIVVELTKTGKFEAEKQPLFEKWFKLGMLSFGRPKTPGNAYAIAQGLKKRDSGEIMQEFVNDIKPAVKALGVRFPDPARIGLECPKDLDWSL